jgi:polyisoprenoid-binding protein YceI
MRRWRFFAFFALVMLVGMLIGGAAHCKAQAGSAARIRGPIDETSRVRLRGNVTAAAQPQWDRGEAPGSTQLTHMRLVLARSRAQQAALNRLEQELQETSSPNYHRWLTPEEFGRRFGPSDADIVAVTGWLESHGFQAEPVAPGRIDIAFSGTASQVEEAFHTTVHAYDMHGQWFYSNTSDPEIPAALAPVIEGIAHLNTLSPRSSAVPGVPGRMDPATKRLTPMGNVNRARPAYNPNGGYLYLVAGDAATIYDTPNPKFNANATAGATYDGTGVTIGVTGTSLIKGTTVQNYRSKFLGDNVAPTITNLDGVTFTDGSNEPYLDVEIAGALAPGATIHYYLANDLNTPIEHALTDNTIDILSFSYYECERLATTSDNAAINNFWQQAAAQGIAVTVATGDSGSANCDDPTNSSGQDNATAVRGLGVNAWASTPNNIAVGGTDVPALTQNFAAYSSDGGSAATYYRTALQYIPEAVWNDSSQFDNGLANNEPWGVGLSPYPANINGGGGGVSSCSTNNTGASVGSCVSGYAKPAWQGGAGVPADGVRDLPDVSLMAGNGFEDATWLVCDDTMNLSTGLTNDCTVQSDGSFSFAAYGGTSTSAPAMAGILALVEQSTGGRLGQAAAQIYNLYNGSHAATIFHDITQGNNSVSCKQGSPNCAKNKNGYYYETGYDAGTGYDLATGLGSVDAAQLIQFWSTATGGAAATVTVTAPPASVPTNQSVTVTVTVTGGRGTPEGTVTLTSGSYTSAATTLTNGMAMITIPANSLGAGTQTLTASYSGDTNYAPATGTATLTVVAPASATVTVTPAAASVPVDQSVAVTVAVAGSGGAATPGGTVTLTSGTYASAGTALVNGTATITIPANSLAVGTDTLTAAYSGDANYAPATGTGTLTVTAVAPPPPATFTLAATSPGAIAAGGSAASTLTITGSNGYAGSVALSCALTGAPTDAMNQPTCAVAGSPVVLSATATMGTASVSVQTTAATSGVVGRMRWFGAAGSSGALALLVLCFPGRIRRWRAMLCCSILAAAVLFAGVGCGSSSSPSKSSGGSGGATKSTPTVAVTAAAKSIASNTAVPVTIAVTGSGATPTGAATLTSGKYASSPTMLSMGAATVTIPANTLATGQDVLTASYSGDANYNAATGSVTLTVTNPPPAGGTTPGVYTFTVTGAGNDAAKTTATATFTVTVS